MADSFKEAMLKAGLISKDSIEREKEKVRREKIQSKGPAQVGIHAHHLRTDCALCNKNSPDVEYYEHTDRRIQAKWLCLECADKSWIPDETRQTAQSQHAKSGMFRRQFGKTKTITVGPAQPQARPGQQAQTARPTTNTNAPPPGQKSASPSKPAGKGPEGPHRGPGGKPAYKNPNAGKGWNFKKSGGKPR